MSLAALRTYPCGAAHLWMIKGVGGDGEEVLQHDIYMRAPFLAPCKLLEVYVAREVSRSVPTENYGISLVPSNQPC